jgi:two-component system, NarL family, sensor kinase
LGLEKYLFTVENNKTFGELQTKYDVDNKNLKIKLLTKNKKIQEDKTRTIVIVGILLLLAALSFLFFYKYRLHIQRLISIKEKKIQQQAVVRLQNEQELKRISGIIEGQDRERNRLAKEIHDGIGASLAGIKLQLSQVNTSLKNENLKKIESQLGTAFTELRLVSHNLSSNFLNNTNLQNLIDELIVEYKSRDEFAIEFLVFPENSLGLLSYTLKHQLYRIVQELLANVSKHALAKNVAITITNHDAMLNMIFEDDGKGFSEDTSYGIGLKNIKERIKDLNGKLIVESKPNQGSSFIFDIPNKSQK